MNDYDFIDLFPKPNQNESETFNEESSLDYMNYSYDGESSEKSYYNEPYSDSPTRERMSFNDYKHASHTLQKGNSRESYESPTPNLGQKNDSSHGPENKKKTEITDDKIVWAGALFVFFGVFVFLIGYWMGKSIMSDLHTGNETQLAEIQESLEEAQMESAFAGMESVDSDSGSIVLSSTPAISLAPAAEVEEPIIAPPVIATPTTTSTTTTTTTTTTVAAVASTTTDTASDISGDYTIQVSAHTSIESARAVEEELRVMGYQSYVVESIVSGVRYFRVRVGSYSGKNAANEILTGLQATDLGADGYLISLD